MKSKMRIRLHDNNGAILDDRLLMQDTELYNGPKEKHKGPISIEFNLKNTDDVDKAILYLQKLAKDTPIPKKEISARGRKPLTPKDTKEALQELLDATKKKCKTQDELIEYLRELGFIFVTYDYLESLKITKLVKFSDKHKKYEFMLKLLKRAKDPKNDKLDPRLIFGIKIWGKRKPKVPVYLYNDLKETLKLEVPDKTSKKIKKLKPMKFPDFMIQNERDKWRKEHRDLCSKPDRKPSKFYKRWAPYIKVPKEQEIPKNKLKKDKKN